MKQRLSVILPLIISSICNAQSLAQNHLKIQNVSAVAVTYQGKPSVQVSDNDQNASDEVHRLAIVDGTECENCSIEVDLAGDTAPNAPANLRGFVGIAFRMVDSGAQYECIYLRPKNGRSQDQLQRNHSVQYISVPGFPWQKLREESPGKYESYVDLVPGRWTHVRIDVYESTARIYVDRAFQPVLIVSDLKQKQIKGPVALWLGPGTIAHFAALKVSPLLKQPY